MSGTKALSLSGRLRVTVRTPPSSETSTADIPKAYNRGMPKVYAIDGITPVVDPSAYVHPSAVLIGDVIVGARAYIGPGASLRGDFGRIVVHEGANIQDTCMLHGFPGKDTVVGAGAIVAALAFVKAGRKVQGSTLVAGIPARERRALTEQERRWKKDNRHLYQQLAVRSATTMTQVEALTAVGRGRNRIDIPGWVR